MEKFTIETDIDRCTGCLRCQLACSELYIQAFNPSEARIRVDMSGLNCSIRFTDECEECGVCADNCFYDALQKAEKEAEK